MNAKIQLRFLILILSAAGLALALTKHFKHGYPLLPRQQTPVWSIEANIRFKAKGDPVKLNFAVPGEQATFGILDESGSSQGYGFTPAKKQDASEDFYRTVTWSRDQAKGTQELYYRTDIYKRPSLKNLKLQSPPTTPDPQYQEGPLAISASEIIEQAKRASADSITFVSQLIQLLANPGDQNAQTLLRVADTDLRRIKLLNTLVLMGGYESHLIRALKLEETQARQKLIPAILLIDRENGIYKTFVWGSPHPLKTDSHLVWQRGGPALIELYGGSGAQVEFSVIRQDLPISFVLEQAANYGESNMMGFSLNSLSFEQQSSYRLLLMIPLGALVVVIMRNIVGIKTSGTFMPILLAMAFLKTELITGMLLFVIVVSVGLIMRSYLSRLDLLLVPRISAVVVVVIGIMVGFGIFGAKFDIQLMQSVTLFPTIILAWTVERLSVLWEEDGAREVATQTGGSLLVAALAYVVMGHPVLRYQAFVFPELLLVVLAIILALGQYSGYRLSELLRFAPLVQNGKGSAQ
ncbi:inactive transglutaminase family protein [Coraliomargarita akajimensis]|uniref:Gonadoliberin III-related protein n=1 Tax=Coraliomargarita akajimensis (strain DSM 45221 / IAM 15411 / JCM 23193 / KCTC 12865 / 04OKA010-24) TaxID=583355 RepID=D5EPU2_CORAD|nr:inactive transglutaminase family protein [Coraliomargarita akajimensis]ADE55675.1 gonadoliberin III-related protein [Coraliomargarita akajimensis DSM 45221]